MKPSQVLGGYIGPVHGLAFRSDGALVGIFDWDIKIWEATAGRIIHSYTGPLTQLELSPNGLLLFERGYRDIRVFDVATGRELYRFNGHGNHWAFAVSPDGRLLATGGDSREVVVWSLETHSCLHALSGDTGIGMGADRDLQGVLSIAFSPDGKSLISVGSLDNMIRIWSPEAGTLRHAIPHNHHWRPDIGAFDPAGKWFATGDSESVRFWLVESGKCITAPIPARSLPRAPDPSGRFVLYVEGHSAIVWDIDGDAEYSTLLGHEDDVVSFAWSRDSRLLATGSRDRTIRVWEIFDS